MVRKTLVISLGGSLIFSKKNGGINNEFLEKFKKILRKHSRKYKFVVVSGGGNVARKYMSSLNKSGKSKYIQNIMGIAVIRVNTRFMSYFFDMNPEKDLPRSMKDIKNLLLKNNIVFSYGPSRYEQDQTSDSTSAKIARYLKAEFVNLTNVQGLYNKDPRKNKNAKLIKKISPNDLYKKARAMKFHPGQHFVIDQYASKIILKDKIKTYILGGNLKNFENFLNNKKFIGTVVE